MSLSQKFRKSNVILLIIIAMVAISLSVASYQYSANVTNEINEIAAEDIRSNAKIEMHDLSLILENKLETVTILLQTLAESIPIQTYEMDRARINMNNMEAYTSDIADFYMWLDHDGRILWVSNTNQTTYEKYSGLDLSYREYFTVPRDTLAPYYSSVIESNDNIPRLYISVPVTIADEIQPRSNTNDNDSGAIAENNLGEFKGVVIAGIRTDLLGGFLKSQLPEEFESRVGLLDKDGIILYTRNQELIGKSISSKEAQGFISQLIPENERGTVLPDLLNRLISGETGSVDITVMGQMNSIVYTPVNLGGEEHFLSLFIIAPHNLASNVNLVIDQQRNFNLVVIGSIGALAVGIAFLILTWNKKLEKTVNAKTAELRQANEQLKIHDRMQKEFINIAAHELRTPIVPILGFSELLYSKIKGRQQQQKGERQQEEQQNEMLEMLQTILRNANRLHQLTEDILDVTRIESNTLKLRKERFNLNDAIVDAVEDYREQIANGNVKLMHEPGNNNTFVVEADRRRVTQVISNLLNNSIKFTKEGTVTISTSIRRKDVVDRDNRGEGGGEGAEEVVIAVKDTGSGIDPELMLRLFTKFATKSYQGTGLGLFIAKSIVEAHGGKIWAENNNNNNGSDRKHKGATFYFTVPVVAMSEERREEEKKEVRLVNDQQQ